MSSQDFLRQRNAIQNSLDATCNKLQRGAEETGRVVDVLRNTPEILNNLDRQFCEKTGLNGTDTAILFLAIGLQIARQYLLTKFPIRIDDQIAAKNTFGHIEEHSSRQHRLYNPSLEEIISNPVPFDANVGANGALSGGGFMRHRVTAIGHDPLLGLIFGTANIATSTLTTNKLKSFHIYTGSLRRDEFRQRARTELVLSYTMDKLLTGGIEGKQIVAVSLMKEIIHLKSDLNTSHSLPLPVVSAIDPQFASRLASYGLDMANVLAVAKQASYATMINTLIAMFHGMFSDATTEMEQKLYEVRTRKILSYSNAVASSSNLAVVAITSDFHSLDLGGLAVTIYRLITDAKFIKQVKEEFIFGNYKSIFLGEI